MLIASDEHENVEDVTQFSNEEESIDDSGL